MAEENLKVDLEVNEDIEKEEEKQWSEVEEQAIAKGWNPEGVEGKRNLSAEEFLDREEFYSQIHSLKRENKRLAEDISNLNKHQKRIREDERKKVVEELKAAKKLAYAAEDYDKVVEIDEQLAEARAPEVEETKENEAAEAFQEWRSQNTWYDKDIEMREYADMIGRGLFDKSMSPTEFYSKVEKEVKTRFADKFATPTTKRTPVESSTRSKPRNISGFSEKNLSEEERSIMRTVLRNTPGMTKEQYLKEYEALIS